MISRRRFIASALAAACTPFAAQAQGKAPVVSVGFISSHAGRNPEDDAFEQTLRDLGWNVGQNIRIEYRYAGGRQESLGKFAAELVAVPVDILVVWSPAGGLAAKRATSRIPVVFLAGGGDPIGIGLVSNLGRPGGNVSGVSSAAALETYAKRLQLLKEAVPSARRIALLDSTESRSSAAKQAISSAAKALKIQVQEVQVAAPAELALAVRKAKDQGADALYVWPSGLTAAHAARISASSIENRLPNIHAFSESAEKGGLFAYAPSMIDIARRGAAYVDKILRGVNVGDMPVEQPARFEFIVNLKTAKALGINIPQSTLLQANKVIE